MAQQKTEGKEKKKKKSLYRTRELHIMLIPAVLFTTFFAYLPIFGLVMAFQDFKPLMGFRESPFGQTAPSARIRQRSHFGIPHECGLSDSLLLYSLLPCLTSFPFGSE